MEKYAFDYRKLNGRIHEICGSQKKFAESMGMSATAISNKLTNKSYFSQQQIETAKEILELKQGSISEYFFTRKI